MIKSIYVLVGVLFSMQVFAQTGIGTSTPDPSAKLHVASTDKGLLIPRMTIAQRSGISSPANGLMVYQTDGVTGFYVNTGSSGTPSWTRVNTDWTKSGNDISFSGGNVSLTGNQTVSGNVTATNFIGSGSQLSNVLTKVTGSWVLAPNSNDVSFSLAGGGTYALWVYGNIPNGIVTWNATVTTANTNVPVVGSQYGWYYSLGNALVLNSIPDQIVGTNNGIITNPTGYAPNTSNIFKFRITNNSGANQTIYWGYTRLD
jgi:hypothetical protein